jgi:hypothetical protein
VENPFLVARRQREQLLDFKFARTNQTITVIHLIGTEVGDVSKMVAKTEEITEKQIKFTG